MIEESHYSGRASEPVGGSDDVIRAVCIEADCER